MKSKKQSNEEKAEISLPEGTYKIKAFKVLNNIVFLEKNQGTCVFNNGVATFDITPNCQNKEEVYVNKYPDGESRRFFSKNRKFDIVTDKRPLKAIVGIANRILKDGHVFLDFSDTIYERLAA